MKVYVNGIEYERCAARCGERQCQLPADHDGLHYIAFFGPFSNSEADQ